MPADNFFTRESFGGVPNYVWLGAGGVAVIFIVRRQGQQKAQPGLTQAQQQQLAMQQQEAALQAQMAQGQMPTYGSSGAPIYVLPQTSPGVSAPGVPAATTPAVPGALLPAQYATQETQLGSGFVVPSASGESATAPPLESYQGQVYSWIPNTAALAGLQAANPAFVPYYQPSPGTFAPVGPGVQPGTAYYQQITAA